MYTYNARMRREVDADATNKLIVDPYNQFSLLLSIDGPFYRGRDELWSGQLFSFWKNIVASLEIIKVGDD
jgi:hypothetical protein